MTGCSTAGPRAGFVVRELSCLYGECPIMTRVVCRQGEVVVEICAGCYLPLDSLCGLANAARYQCQVSVREREDGILFFHYRGGEQIIKSMKRKVTLSREGSTHSPLSFPVTAHPSQVPHLNFKLERLRLLYVACKYHIEGYITKD